MDPITISFLGILYIKSFVWSYLLLKKQKIVIVDFSKNDN